MRSPSLGLIPAMLASSAAPPCLREGRGELPQLPRRSAVAVRMRQHRDGAAVAQHRPSPPRRSATQRARAPAYCDSASGRRPPGYRGRSRVRPAAAPGAFASVPPLQRRWRRVRGPAVAHASRAARPSPSGAPGAARAPGFVCGFNPACCSSSCESHQVNSLLRQVAESSIPGTKRMPASCAGSTRFGQTRCGVMVGQRRAR